MSFKALIIISLLTLRITVEGQYAPAAGQAGSTAIHKDSVCFVAWANASNLVRGWQNIADTSLGLTITGSTSSPIGMPDNDVLSLGDGGIVTIFFNEALANGPGWDFAVFENSFDGNYLELAFVEVSSDGINFFRFPSHSLTQSDYQVASFGTLNPQKINNLAGKYIANYGTPFDLDSIEDNENLDKQRVIAIKIIDVVGSISPLFGSTDTAGNIINDPWPTPFSSGGFDLDAIGVINLSTSLNSRLNSYKPIAFPNPASKSIRISNFWFSSYEIYGLDGKLLSKGVAENGEIDVSNLLPGIYVLNLDSTTRIKFSKQ